MDFTKIKMKDAPNYNPIYLPHLIEHMPIEFFQNYTSLIYENDFIILFNYHSDRYLDNIIERMKKVACSFPNKKYSLEHICHQILISQINKEDKVVNLTYHMYAFYYAYNKIVNEIKDEIKKTPLTDIYKNDIINAKTKHLSKLMIDSSEVLQYLEKASGIEPESIIHSRRQIDGYEIFWFIDLFASGIIDYSNNTYFSTLVYLIRQSIEIRVKNGLGIQAILHKNKPQKITSDIFIDFIFNNNNINFPDINKAVLRKVFNWCNYHIHTGAILYTWQFIIIQDYLRPLFSLGQTKKQIHISGSIRMLKEYYKNSLEKELIDFLKNKGKIVDKIVLQNTPEAILE